MPTTPSTSAAASVPSKTGYVDANRVHYYYEIHGTGEPLLLLHGGLGSIAMFGPLLRQLATGRQVIAVDLHGHGRTALGDRPISLIDQGDDMAEIVRQLGIAQLDVMGYSLGAAIAFRFAAQHPAAVRRLVLVSAAFATDGFYPDILQQQAQIGPAIADAMKNTPMYQSYVKVAPHPEQFPELLARIGDLMRTRYDWSADVAKLTMPTLLVYADGDMFRPEHMVAFYQRLGGGLRDAGWMREHRSKNQLAILPDLTHYDIFLAPQLVATVRPFLDGKSGATSWAEQVSRE